METTLDTSKALHQMRLASTGPSKIDMDRTRREKAAEEQIDKLRPKPKKRSKVDKLRDRIKANNMGSEVPAQKRKVPDYIARILTDVPMTVKDFPELEQEAEDNYFAAKSQAFQDNFGSKVGVPRPIYVDFIGKVVEDYSAQLERKALSISMRRSVKMESQKHEKMSSKDSRPSIELQLKAKRKDKLFIKSALLLLAAAAPKVKQESPTPRTRKMQRTCTAQFLR